MWWFKEKIFSGNCPNRKNLPICIKRKLAFFLRTTLPLCDFVIFMYKVRPKNKYIYSRGWYLSAIYKIEMEYRWVFVKSTKSSLNSYTCSYQALLYQISCLIKNLTCYCLSTKWDNVKFGLAHLVFLRVYLTFFSFCRRMELEKWKSSIHFLHNMIMKVLSWKRTPSMG